MERFFNWTAMPSPGMGWIIYATNEIPKIVRGDERNIHRLTRFMQESSALELTDELAENFDVVIIDI